MNPHAYNLYSDGNNYRKTDYGGFAVALEYPSANWKEPEIICGKGYISTTNNRMELRAVIEAMKWIERNQKRLKYPTFDIHSDSAYIVDNQFICAEWRKNKWRNHNGKPILNHCLWREYLNQRTKVVVNILKIKGKSTDLANLVDKAAKRFGQSPTTKDLGHVSGKFAKSQSPNGRTEIFPADGNTYTVRHFMDKLVIKGEYEIRFDLYSVEDEEYVGKYKAYISSDMVDELHRGHHYDLTFNDNKKHPLITKVVKNLEL